MCEFPPAVTVASVGTGLLTVNGDGADGPTAGAGLLATTLGVPAVTMSAAGTVTLICVAVTEIGVSPLSEPKSTLAPATKLLPLIVNVKAAPFADALAGDSEV